MPLFESGLKAEGGSTFSVAIASPFESSSTLPSRSEPLPPSAHDLVDCLRRPQTSAGHHDRAGSADTLLTAVCSFCGRRLPRRLPHCGRGERLPQARAIIARSGIECRKPESCSCLDRVFLSPLRLCRRIPSLCPDCQADRWRPTFCPAEYICPWT